MAIPKIIHYCWFGRNEKSDFVKKCIETWKTNCPDYTIKEWNEDCISFSDTAFAQEAYNEKKWAFVSDYVRLVALTTEGGFYLDTDIEMLKPLDPLLNNSAIAGFEEKKYIMTGFIAAEPNNRIFNEWLELYKKKRFINDDGTLNTTTNVHDFTTILLQHGLNPNGKKQSVSNITVFPSDFFSPKDYYSEKIRVTKNSFTIHHFKRSWCDMESKKERFLRKHPWIKYLYYTPNRIGKFILRSKYDSIKRRLKK